MGNLSKKIKTTANALGLAGIAALGSGCASEDYNLAAAALGIINPLANVPVEGHVLMGAAEGYAGRQAIIEGQKEAADRVVDGLRGQGSYSVNQQAKEDINREQFQCKIGTIWKDLNRDGKKSADELFGDDFYQDSKIYLVCENSKYGQRDWKRVISDSNGNVICVSKEPFDAPVGGMSATILPYELQAGKFVVKWYVSEKFVGEKEFEIKNKTRNNL